MIPNSALETLREAARLAPSGDNTQPWCFELTPATNSLKMILVPERDSSPMNAANNMARIAFGAALENMVQTAKQNDWQLSHEFDSESITVRLPQNYPAGTIPRSIADRATNRKKYHGTELSQTQLDVLKKTMDPNDSEVAWITKPEERMALCKLIAQADSMILSSEPVRRAFLEKVRFDQPVLAEVEEGLSLGSLEVSAFERLGLRMMPYFPDMLLRNTVGPSMFYGAAHKLATSASGFCIITSNEASPNREYNAGRLFQRAWVALTAHQLAAQPMMSLLVLQNMLNNLNASEIPTIQQEKSFALLSSFRELVNSATPVAMLRFGPADLPSVRTGRLANKS